MSYTELESGYQGLQNRPGFYVGDDGNLLLDRVSLFFAFTHLLIK